MKGEKFPRVLGGKSRNVQFQLYNNTKSSGKLNYFLKPSEGKEYSEYYGQVRSVNHEGQCVTAGGALGLRGEGVPVTGERRGDALAM